jgi:hypothetical protein
MRVKRKNISNKEAGYKKNRECRNCPYFINKLVCPFRRKEVAKELEAQDSGTHQR